MSGGHYPMVGGRVLTDADVQALADEAEAGYDLDSVVVDVALPVFGEVRRGVSLTIHGESKCAGRACPFHAPSDHPMREWPKVVRLDKGTLVERTCEHGVGHPDPDSLAFLDPTGERMLGVHGCDGCCLRAA